MSDSNVSNEKHLRNFAFDIPVEFEKAKDGKWKIKGLASTEHIDQQGEIIKMSGLDITALKEGKGIFNYNHKDGPENVVGVIENGEIKSDGLYVEGYLLKNCDRAIAIYNILESLEDKDKTRLGMSVEGKVLQRTGPSGQIIASAKIDKVALTLDPVNPYTYTQLIKSLHDDNCVLSKQAIQPELLQPSLQTETQVVEFEGYSEEEVIKTIQKAFDNVKKALAAGSYNSAPSTMTGGTAMSSESLEDEKKKKAKLKSTMKSLLGLMKEFFDKE